MLEKDNELEFDFDHWANIAKEDPARFESMREAILEETLQQSPVAIRRRMEGLQWRIDQTRNRSANPMASCLRISKMMWNSVLGEHGLLTALETPEKILKPQGEDQKSKVIHLNRQETPDN